MDFASAIAWLDSHLNHETAPSAVIAGRVEGLSLEPMRELMALLGDPQHQIPSIHITGTNGKGTVAAMTTALLSTNGLSVGTYSSPHISRLNERITRNGVPISDDDLAEVLTGIAAVEPLLDHDFSWFEILTAAAFRWFGEVPVDAAVVEVGLLGRHDATNVIDSQVAVVTAIHGDHTDFAPGWEMAIASEKAGIISPHSTAVIGELSDELSAVFSAEGPERLLRSGVDFEAYNDRVALGGHLVDIRGIYGTYEDVFVPLRGNHQVKNAAIAVVAAEAFFGRELASEVVTEAFGALVVPGRFEVVGHKPLAVIDAAHNEDAIAATARTLDDEFDPVGRRIVVVGLLGGRDVARTMRAIGSLRPDLVIATTLPPPRGVDSSQVIRGAEALGMTVESVEDPVAAVARAIRLAEEEDLIVVIGSFRMIAPAKEAFGIRSD